MRFWKRPAVRTVTLLMLTAIHQPLAALFGAIYRRIRFKKTKLFHPSHSKRPHCVSQRGLRCLWGRLTGSRSRKKTLNSWELIWRRSGGQTRQHNSLSFAVCLRCQPRTGASPSINLTHTHSARPHNLPHRPASLVSLSMSPFRCECASVCVCVGPTLVRVHIRGRVGSCWNRRR